MLRESRELLAQVDAPQTPETLAFEAAAYAVLALAPGETSCAACLNARERARKDFLGHDDPPPDAPCHVHAQCAECETGR
jgi:hypothetical protein